jgi:hypothetical protein
MLAIVLLALATWDLAFWDPLISELSIWELVISELGLLSLVGHTGSCSCRFGKDQGMLRSFSCTRTVRDMKGGLCHIPGPGVPKDHYTACFVDRCMGNSVDHSARHSTEGGSVGHCSERSPDHSMEGVALHYMAVPVDQCMGESVDHYFVRY